MNPAAPGHPANVAHLSLLRISTPSNRKPSKPSEAAVERSIWSHAALRALLDSCGNVRWPNWPSNHGPVRFCRAASQHPRRLLYHQRPVSPHWNGPGGSNERVLLCAETPSRLCTRKSGARCLGWDDSGYILHRSPNRSEVDIASKETSDEIRI